MSKTEQAYVQIGRTRKAHGLTGEIKISIEDQYLEDFLKTERIFLFLRGAHVPYFIANVRGKGELIVQLEDVKGRDGSQAIQAKEIFLRAQDILTEEDREFEIAEEEGLEYARLVGYQMFDQKLGEIGTINEVLEMPQQEMAFMQYKGREVLIPLNDQFIVDIDDKKRQVQMDLPEGLLDV